MKRIFAAFICHETHGFNKLPTTLKQFKEMDYAEADAIKECAVGDSGWTGVYKVAREQNWELVHPISTSTMPSGPATRETFEYLWAVAEKSLRKDGPFDGIIWQMHGGMMCEHLDDPEGEIIKRTRAIVGNDLPIAIALDIHGNVSPAMVKLSDIICGFHTTPHVDVADTSFRAAKLLQRTMSGEIKPVTYSVHPPVLVGIDHGRTTREECPIPTMLRRFKKMQAEDSDLLDISFFSGFPFCDTSTTRASAMLVANGAEPRFDAVIQEFGDEIWNTRDQVTIDFVTMDEAIDQALAPSDKKGPFLIGDYTDTPHGGGYGDVISMLKKLIERDVKNAAFGPVWDSAAVAKALKAGPGANIDIALGGHCDPTHGGGPLQTRALVKAVSEKGNFEHKGPFSHGLPGELGPSAWIEVQGVDVIIIDRPDAIYDREQFRIFGINPEDKDVLVIKAYNHFRADFEPIGKGLLYADSGGIFSFDFKRFDYKKVRRPIWPLDQFERSEGVTDYARTSKF